MKRLCGWLALFLALALLTGCGDEPPTEDVPNPIATITMEDGSVMTAELYASVAPNTVANFVKLANSGFYDGLTFYRILPGVLIQTGDQSGTGNGDAGYTIAGEFKDNGFSNSLSHTRGTLSMSRLESDYNSASSQFFIMQGSYGGDYDGHYAAFGCLTGDESYATLDVIAAIPVDAGNRPLIEARIDTIRVETFGHEYSVKKIDKPDK